MGRLRKLSKRNWHQQLERLQRELKEYAYRHLPVRQHWIPNRDKPGECRMLGIPAT